MYGSATGPCPQGVHNLGVVTGQNVNDGGLHKAELREALPCPSGKRQGDVFLNSISLSQGHLQTEGRGRAAGRSNGWMRRIRLLRWLGLSNTDTSQQSPSVELGTWF